MRRLFFSVLLACGFSSCVTEEHKWVDLGLSVKWATCNLGASAPEEYGDYYAWGEVATKTEYTESNCSTIDKSLIELVRLKIMMLLELFGEGNGVFQQKPNFRSL